MDKIIFLYGIENISRNYRPARYIKLSGEERTIDVMRFEARMMQNNYPSIEHVYAIDARYGLYREFMNALTNDFSNGLAFKDTLEREGIKII